MEKLNLEAETICDFYVDEKRKKVWQTELNILEKIIEICDKNNLKYSLAGGSLLGVIRHKGYIPWDDDIDIVMLRQDYNRFLDIAKKEFEEPYFVQYNETEKGYFYGHAQIRNSNTTAIIKGDAINKTFNHGIFVDIFPLDNVPNDEKSKKKFLKEITFKKRIIEIKTNPKSHNIIKSIIKQLLVKILYRKISLESEIAKFNKFVQKYNNELANEIGAIAFRPDEFKYERKWMEEFEERDFEYLKVKISKYYDELLKRQYGDYMKIPENKNGTLHGKVFFDTEKSYLTYNDNIEEIVKKLN